MSELIKCLICDKELEQIKYYIGNNKTKYIFCSKQCSDDFDFRFTSAKFIEGCRHGVIMLSEPLQNSVGLLVESVLLKIQCVNEVTITPDRILVSYSVRLSILGSSKIETLLVKKIQNQQILLMKNLLLDVESAIKDSWFERMPKNILKCETESH